MSGTLDVRVEAMMYEDDVRAGVRVVGNIFPAGGGGDTHRQVLIPVGSNVPAASFAVQPGRYLVEATLPSGVVLCDEVDVAEGQPTEVRLRAQDSPHETHSWQYVVGNVESGTVYRSPDTIPVPNSAGSRSFGRLRDRAADDSLESVARPARVRWVLDRAPSGPPLDRLGLLGGGVAVDQWLESTLDVSAQQEIDQPSATDGVSPLYRFTSAVHPAAGQFARQFLTVESQGDAYLVTLPCPWLDRNHTESVVEVLVNGRQSPTGSAVSVTVRDPSLGAGLAYLAAGALSKAEAVFSDAQHMLHGKVANHLAAAAGAYVLVGTDLAPERREWDAWLDNLRRWFPQMSDGSILCGVRGLRLAQTQADVDAARDALLEGCQRGLPAYTLGISWLVEALSEFPDDPACMARLDQVRRLSWRVDLREPFVVLRLTGDAT
jgi:hypothetical protein